MKKSLVASIPINKNYNQSLDKTFKTFPDIIKKIKESKRIFLKICIDHLYDYQHTNLELLQLILGYIRHINPLSIIFVMENNVYGNFTRLLANVSGITGLIKNYKAKFIYLDEQNASPNTIGSPENRYEIQFPEILLGQFITEREKNFYLNIAQLKTHYLTKMAGAIFNQIGLINQQSFRFVHGYDLHQTLVDLLRYIKPDFTIVDANVVVAHGTMPPECLIEKYAIPVNRLLSGIDTLAVDRVALKMLGYSPLEVEHVKLAIGENLGEGDLDYIDIKGDLFTSDKKVPYSPELSQLPPKMDIIFGNKKFDYDSCLGLSLQFAQIIYRDFIGNRKFTLVVGSDFSKYKLIHLRQPIIVLGEEACEETAQFLNTHYNYVYFIDHYDDVRQIIAVLAKVMGISKYNLIGVNPLTVWKHLFIGRLKGLKYKLPSISKNIKYGKISSKSINGKVDKKNSELVVLETNKKN